MVKHKISKYKDFLFTATSFPERNDTMAISAGAGFGVLALIFIIAGTVIFLKKSRNEKTTKQNGVYFLCKYHHYKLSRIIF